MKEHTADKEINIHEVLGAFNEINDPRRSPATRHIFNEMLFMSLAAMIAGAEGFVDIEEFSKSSVLGLMKLPSFCPVAYLLKPPKAYEFLRKPLI